MIVRFDSVSAAPRAKRAQGRRAIRATVAAASFLFCGFAAAQGGASAAPGAAASAATGASSAAAAVGIAGQYTVRPGQSLHDVAVDVTQSHDKATLARMSQALFNANPGAFIKQDPSRMRVGATLNVPATPDVSSAAAGITAASGGAASAGASAAASAPAAAAPASTPTAASSAAASSAAAEAVAAASSAAAAATGGASSASTAATTATTASATASAVPASSPEAAAQGASGAAALGASAAAPAASDAHVWSGSIQSAPASGASAQSAKGAPVTVSSLQQLLALKNRVLMALQQHGIGKPAQTAGGASAGAPVAQGGAPVQNGAANAGPAGGQPEVSPIAMGAVAAVVVALLALFVRLLMRKRKKPADQAPEVSSEAHEPTPSGSAAAAVAAAPAAEETPVLREPVTRAGDEPGVNDVAPVEEAQFAPPVEPAEPAADEATITPVPTPVVTAAPLEHDEAPPPTLTETLHPAAPQGPAVAQEVHAAHELPHGVEPGEPQTLADATEVASLAAAAALGADALPPESAGAPRTAEDAEALARTLEEPARAQQPAAPDIALDFGDGVPQAAPAAQTPQAEPPVATPPIGEAFERPPAPRTAPEIPSAPTVTEEDTSYAAVPIAFPHDAVEALGGLDLPLPPRIGEPVMPTQPLSTEPAATPEASARLAAPFFEPPAPLAGQAIEAGTAGAGALAGLGAPRFGALTLDFDLNLPPDAAEPLPVFTPEQLARIARNKLDLAHEYIALGDVSGARSLINEVIESNDPATRSDAQALLSTLAPLS
ncbi:FimV/HubP family polar landmark protein [Paraburkholderia silvatlantica]|uniref:FimV-like protein n=1 Tax=Paraburkholderia silvatlantica TaxID=321895 RepID=A0ABR6FXU5_9BURK|nr:FimV/HubP family polar landmark protein [Paraburkholderia silvatlantica]MBB2931364.1 FimV-like protein [Paraburkholderia silvatlantica]PVY28202.1 FimV-like protein [Paraburkholderia silvatlantica]PXW34887.1 FimV-like protein [Paraburkholderia silvatlantica]TDQ98794.1 FimV-like protein [Paraburkholderia silvatlantica]